MPGWLIARESTMLRYAGRWIALVAARSMPVWVAAREAALGLTEADLMSKRTMRVGAGGQEQPWCGSVKTQNDPASALRD